LTRTRFDNAKEEDLDATPLSFEQLDRVLLRLEERDPAAWLITEEGEMCSRDRFSGKPFPCRRCQ